MINASCKWSGNAIIVQGEARVFLVCGSGSKMKFLQWLSDGVELNCWYDDMVI